MAQVPEHLNVPWRPLDALVVFLLPWLILPVVLIELLKATAHSSALANTALTLLAAGNPVASFIFSMIISLSALGVIAYFLHKRGASWRDLGLRKFNVAKAIGYLLLVLLLFIMAVPVVFAVVKYLLPHFNPDQIQSNDFTSPTTSGAVRLSFLALVIVPPIIEEIIFRGFIFPALASRWGVIAGAVLTSLIFGLAHLQANVGVYTALLSLLLCWMYLRLRSIIPGMVLHMINNYLTFYAILHK
jgi:hypothetical protein